MTEPDHATAHDVHRDASAPGGQLVMRADVVQGWIDAYNRYADALQEVYRQVSDRTDVPSFGNLDSLDQLAAGYHDLLVGDHGSVRARLGEFIATARQFAAQLQADWERIQQEDLATSRALSDAGAH